MGEVVLSLDRLSKRFGALLANEDVSLDLCEGEIHALIGPNGAGKSTLVKQVAGEIRPDGGSIIFDGQLINGLNTAARARAGLGRTFQVSSLISEFSVLQNVMLAVQGQQGNTFQFFRRFSSDAELGKLAGQTIEELDLQDRADVPVSQLSHGERRQLEMACALALKPRALLLDEPLAGIGPAGSQHMTQLLKKLKQQVPILLIEHDMAAVFELADRISVMVYGRIITTGTAHEIRNNKQVQEAYLGQEAS
ncbi:MAG: ATP-binding cassette domain-containing protein [Rhizobiaceae bacterium]|nr:ATP-binding cassette domain-containing protein [Rhizobiaceae bacterium]